MLLRQLLCVCVSSVPWCRTTLINRRTRKLWLRQRLAMDQFRDQQQQTNRPRRRCRQCHSRPAGATNRSTRRSREFTWLRWPLSVQPVVWTRSTTRRRKPHSQPAKQWPVLRQQSQQARRIRQLSDSSSSLMTSRGTHLIWRRRYSPHLLLIGKLLTKYINPSHHNQLHWNTITLWPLISPQRQGLQGKVFHCGYLRK